MDMRLRSEEKGWVRRVNRSSRRASMLPPMSMTSCSRAHSVRLPTLVFSPARCTGLRPARHGANTIRALLLS